MLSNWGYYCRRWWLHLGKMCVFLLLFHCFPLSLSLSLFAPSHLYLSLVVYWSDVIYSPAKNWIPQTHQFISNIGCFYVPSQCPLFAISKYAIHKCFLLLLLVLSLALGSHSPSANDFKICLWVSALYIAMFVFLVYSNSLCNQTISNYVFLFIRWLCFVYVVNFDRFSRNSTIFWFAMNEYQVTFTTANPLRRSHTIALLLYTSYVA